MARDNIHATRGRARRPRHPDRRRHPARARSTLALALYRPCRGRSGCLRGWSPTTRCFCRAHHGRLVCAAPPTIAGLVEVRGLGPRPLAFEPKAPCRPAWSGWSSATRRRAFRRRRRERSAGLRSAAADACRPTTVRRLCRRAGAAVAAAFRSNAVPDLMLRCVKMAMAVRKFGLVNASRVDKIALPPTGQPEGRSCAYERR